LIREYMGNYVDDGNGDKIFGVDNLWHTEDYELITRIVKGDLKPQRRN
jgi:hypothetical protein